MFQFRAINIRRITAEASCTLQPLSLALLRSSQICASKSLTTRSRSRTAKHSASALCPGNFATLLSATRQPSCQTLKPILRRHLSQAPPQPSGPIFEVDARNFMQIVMESPEPVILDCYASWCQPCKDLTPRLEKAVRETKGVRLAKLDTDANQEIASQLRVDVLPTLFLLHEGKVVEKVTGNLRPEGIQSLMAKAAALSTGAGANDALIAAGQRLAAGDVAAARGLYADALAAARASHGHLALAGLALCAMAARDLPAAAELVDALRREFPKNLDDPIVKQAVNAVEIASASHAMPEDEVKALANKIDSDPDDHTSRRTLATALFGRQQYEQAMHHALEIVRRDKHWDDGGGRRLLFQFFDTLGNSHDQVIAARRRLALLLF